MDNLVVNTWQSANGTTYSAPLQMQIVNIPYSAAAGVSLGASVTSLSGYTTSNTSLLYSFTFTPVSASSYIMFWTTMDCDRNNNVNTEHLCVFVDNVCYASGYLYPRVSGAEPHQYNMSGTVTNSATTSRTFSIRCANGGTWTQSIGSWNGNGALIGNTIAIMEYQR